MLSLIPFSKNNNKTLAFETANSWVNFDNLTEIEKTKLYQDSQELILKHPKKITKAMLTAFKKLNIQERELLGISIGCESKAEGIFSKFFLQLDEPKYQCLHEVAARALAHQEMKLPELNPDIIERLLTLSFLDNSKLHLTNKIFSQKSRLLPALITCINSGKLITDLKFKSLQQLEKFLEKNCEKITRLCIPDKFIFNKQTITDWMHYWALNPNTQELDILPFNFKISEKKDFLLYFKNLDTLSLKKTSGTDYCFAIHLGSLNCKIDLDFLPSYPHLHHLEINCSKKVDLTPLKNSNIQMLTIIDHSKNAVDLTTDYATLSECQALKRVNFISFKKDDYNFLLNIPNLKEIRFNKNECTVLDNKVLKELIDKEVTVWITMN
jgi:hypothetical protein